tara:strand:+ start:768 stop:1037 length:270 start_codon:yes stop_codon:yes gene_type:complete
MKLRLLKLAKPQGIRCKNPTMPLPAPDDEILEELNSHFHNRCLVQLVCFGGDLLRFQHEEWLLAEDWHVDSHEYYLVKDCIYSVAAMEG